MGRCEVSQYAGSACGRSTAPAPACNASIGTDKSDTICANFVMSSAKKPSAQGTLERVRFSNRQTATTQLHVPDFEAACRCSLILFSCGLIWI